MDLKGFKGFFLDFEGFYGILRNFKGLTMFKFVWLCLNYAAMHKFCACCFKACIPWQSFILGISLLNIDFWLPLECSWNFSVSWIWRSDNFSVLSGFIVTFPVSIFTFFRASMVFFGAHYYKMRFVIIDNYNHIIIVLGQFLIFGRQFLC